MDFRQASNFIMNFRQASNFIMKFGKYKGQTIGDIGSTDEGLKYLDWLRGERQDDNIVDKAISTYLDDTTIAKDLDRLVNGG